ncbi:MAG TPA: ATP-binding protein [Candidatus Polarisedimenticolia bacterium]|nr:ATP-binding protein [Candidatus Polarisedimenticolia bacterium]
MRTRSVLQAGTDPVPPGREALDAAWSFLRHAPFGVVAVGRDGTVLSINPAASRLLGYTPEEVEGEAVARILRAPRGESHVSPGACAAPEEPREVEAVTRSGDVLPLGLRLLPLEGRDGTLEGTLALFQDLREQKALEEQWRRRDRLASLGALAAGVAHEIRNPLAGILTSAQVMKRRLEVGDPRAQFIDLIQEEVSRLERIVTGLLQFAKPNAPRLQRQSILPALEKALTLVHEVAVRQNVLLHVERADQVPDVYIDLDQMVQVVLNVIMNALQALDRGGEIRVHVGPVRKKLPERARLGRRSGDRLSGARPAPLLDLVEVRIEDNGPGIPAAVLARVFDPFYTTRSQGTGLGLSICQTIVREHGGSISIESVVGQGTAVLLDLPVEKRHGDRRGNPR